MLATLAMIIYPDIFKRVVWAEDFNSEYEAWRDVLYRYKASRLKKLTDSNFATIIVYLVDSGIFRQFAEDDKTLQRYFSFYMRSMEALCKLFRSSS